MIAYLIIYFGILGIVGFILRKHSSGDDFLLSKRDRNWVFIGASLFTLIGGGELATLSTLSYFYGNSGIYLFVGFSLGFLALIYFVPRIRSNSESNLFHSLPDYFYEKYGQSSGLISTVLSFIAFFALLIIQFSAGAQIVSALSGWEYLSSVLIIGGVIIIYLLFGGFKSVLATDIIQGIAMLILLPLILWAISNTKEYNLDEITFEGIDGFSIISFVFTGLFVVLASSDIWQRIYAAKDNSNANKGLVLASVLFILFGLGLCGLGIFAKAGLPAIDPNNAFVDSVTTLLPVWASTLVVLLVFSSIMSTADTEIFLLSSILSRELIRWKGGYKNNKLTSEQTTTSHARIAIIIVTVLSISTSIFFDDLVDIYVFLLSVILVISPPLIVGFFTTLNNKTVTVSILVSLVVFFSLIVTKQLNADNLVIIVIPSFLVTLLMKIFQK